LGKAKPPNALIVAAFAFATGNPEPKTGGIALARAGVGIKVRDNEPIDRVLRRFKRAVNRSRLLREYRQHMYYIKPSEERRMEEQKALRNARRHSQQS
jgi:small subunit ribosomal protein S21